MTVDGEGRAELEERVMMEHVMGLSLAGWVERC
jgi:hypothetical protein